MATFSVLGLLKEARRRRVFRVTAIYIVGAWVALQVAALAFPGLGIEESAILYVWIGAILGLPIALFFGWRYDIIGGRIVRTDVSDDDADLSIERTDYIILGTLSVVVTVIAFGLVGEISKTRAPETAQFSITEIHPKSIAVLPFVNMSDDSGNDYFSAGLSEELLNLLARIPELRVAARTSSFAFKDNLDIKISEIANELNVAHLLEGGVRKDGDQIRITVQLVDGANGFRLWSESYDRRLDSIFAIQTEIANEVVERLKVTLLGDLPVVRQTDPETFALFLQARHLNRQNNVQANQRAQALLHQAIEIDPDYAPTWIELAVVYWAQLNLGLGSLDEVRLRTLNALNKALELDRTNALVYVYLSFFDEGLNARADHLQRALQLEPRNIELIRAAGGLLMELGRLDEAAVMGKFIATRDPVNPDAHFGLGKVHFEAGRWDEAISALRTTLILSPDHNLGRYLLGVALLLNDETQAALESMQLKDCTLCMAGLPVIYHALGRQMESDAALEGLITQYEDVAAYNISYIYAYRGESDRAFEWLHKAVHNEDSGLSGITTEPLFSNLHNDPRWLPFLESIGRSPEQLAAIEFEVTLPE